MLVTNGATGIVTDGAGNEIKNTGNATVRDANSVGFVIDGERNVFNNKGNIDVSLNGTGAEMSGDSSQATLDGDINVTAVEDSNGLYRGAQGLDMAGDRLDHVVRRHIQPVAPENYGASVCCQNMIIRFVNEFRKIEAGFFANFAPHIGVHVDPGSIEIVRFQ